MKREEKVLNKLSETEGRINGAFVMFLLVILLEIFLAVLVARAIEGAEVIRVILGTIMMCGLFCLVYLETTGFFDFVDARFRELKNVIRVAFYKEKDLEFIGEESLTDTKEEE